MKSLICTSLILLFTAQAFGFQPPPPPMAAPPVPLTIVVQFPDCPRELVGQFGSLYHYVTETCLPNGDESFSQSTTELAVPQCDTSTGSCGAAAPPGPVERITAPTLAAAKTLVNDGLTDLTSFEARYMAVTNKRANFLRGLKDYRTSWKTYLDSGGTLAVFNADYDPQGWILAADKDAKATWGRLGVGGGNSPWAPVSNDTKVQQDGTLETIQAGWTVAADFYLTATNGSDTVYFRWLDIKKGAKHSYVAFQVDEAPADCTTYPAEFTEKNKYTHLITWEFGTVPLFATTYTELTP